MADQTVAALVVSPGNSPFLKRTLRAVAAQTKTPDRIILVRVGDTELPRISGIEHVDAPDAKNFGDALRAAIAQDPTILDAGWLWTLHDDSAPNEEALENLTFVGNQGLTTGIVGPKQIAWSDPTRLLEVGIYASRAGRRLEHIQLDEIDQGQHDATSDVLAVGTAGMLIRTALWRITNGPDPLLGPFGDGLELSRRIRQMGYRTVIAPGAKIAHARASYRDVREGEEPNIMRSFGMRRSAQLYNAMLANPALQFVLMIALLPLWTIARMVMRLMMKQPELVIPELRGALHAYQNLPSAIRKRKQLRQAREVPRGALTMLEVSNSRINRSRRALAKREREPKPVELLEPVAARLLRAHKTRAAVAGIAGAILATVVASLAGSTFAGGITGAAWVNLPSSFTTLWHQAWAGWVVGGAGGPGPSDPLLIVWALASAPFALLGIAPSTLLTWFWLAAPVLVWVAMYMAAATLNHRSRWRFAFATIWTAMPTFLISWSSGRMAGVLVHAALPFVLLGWMRMLHLAQPLRIRGAESAEIRVQDRTYAVSYAGLASAALVVVVSSAPWLGLALIVTSIVLIAAKPSRWRYTLLSALPALVIMLPTWIAAASYGGTRALRFLLADSGHPLSFATAPTWQTVLGIPQADLPVFYTPWLWAIPGGLALLGATAALLNFRSHWLRTRFVYVVAVGAFAIAIVASRTAIAYDGTLVGAWPGPALSVAAISLLVAWAGLLRPLVLQERLYTYRARRRLDKSRKRQRKAERKAQRQQNASNFADLSDSQAAGSATDAVAENIVETAAGSAVEGTTESVDDRVGDSAAEGAVESTTEGMADGAIEGAVETVAATDADSAIQNLAVEQPASQTTVAATPAQEPRPAKPAREQVPPRLRSSVSVKERILRPLGALGLVATLVVGASVIVAWVNLTGADERPSGFIAAAPLHETPAAAQFAQAYPRHARFLVMNVTEEGVSATLHRGNGRELADSSPKLRLERAIEMQYFNEAGVFDTLASSDLASADFSRTVGELLTNSDSAGLARFAIDQIALSGEGAAFAAAQTALDSNPNLERAGQSDVGALWRARPAGIEPARIYIDDHGKLTPVTSGMLGATVDLAKYEFEPGALLVLSERADDGWRATIGPDALNAADYGWQQAFELGDANGAVKIAYHAEWLLAWWALSALAVVGIVLAAVPIRRRARKDEA
ncbi:MAG: glycosyltransferase [Actinomycetaceae bacterium]|nr:glycosyltransferase [Actinomycetaceae bacterium]